MTDFEIDHPPIPKRMRTDWKHGDVFVNGGVLHVVAMVDMDKYALISLQGDANRWTSGTHLGGDIFAGSRDDFIAVKKVSIKYEV